MLALTAALLLSAPAVVPPANVGTWQTVRWVFDGRTNNVRKGNTLVIRADGYASYTQGRTLLVGSTDGPMVTVQAPSGYVLRWKVLGHTKDGEIKVQDAEDSKAAILEMRRTKP